MNQKLSQLLFLLVGTLLLGGIVVSAQTATDDLSSAPATPAVKTIAEVPTKIQPLISAINASTTLSIDDSIKEYLATERQKDTNQKLDRIASLLIIIAKQNAKK